MRRRRKWLRRIGRAAGTVAIGLLIGFIVPTVAQDLSPKPQLVASVAEITARPAVHQRLRHR